MKDEAALASDEAPLAHAAAAGDGSAFAALYERYEQLTFNFAYRVVGAEADAAGAVQRGFLDAMRRLQDPADGEPALRPLLLAATRGACYDVLHERRAMPPSEAVPGEEVRDAALRLPEHQREAMALRELAAISYDEIATIMEIGRGSVAQLISRAQINLHDELRGNVIAAVAAPSAECERALPLIAAHDDDQLDAASRDAVWLEAHLADCSRCTLAVEVMQKAGGYYRSWTPIVAPPGLQKETMAKAAELTGAERNEELVEAAAGGAAVARPDESSRELEPGESGRSGGSAVRDGATPQRRRATLAAGLAALLLLAGVAAAVFTADEPPSPPVDPAAGSAPRLGGGSLERGPSVAKAGKGKQGGKAKKKMKARRIGGAAAAEQSPATATTGETTSVQAPTPVQAPAGDGGRSGSPSQPDGSSGKTAIQPKQPTSTSKPAAKPKPAPAPAPPPLAPAPAPQPPPAPVVAAPPPSEESPGKSGHAEPPGKPADRPPKK